MDVRRVFDNPWVFGISQRLIPFTVWVYEDLARRHFGFAEDESVLDIGCGIGAHRALLRRQRYTGIDLNPAYIERATRTYGAGFRVMDASRMKFADATFDGAVCVATLHHLSDELVRDATREALRVVKPEGALHLIDPVLPLDPRAWLKRLVFQNDRGRFQRTLEELTALAAEAGRIARSDLRHGLLHDVAYLRLERRG